MFEFVFHRRCRRNDLRQLFGARHRFDAVTFDDGAGNTFTKTLFTKSFDDPGDIGFVGGL